MCINLRTSGHISGYGTWRLESQGKSDSLQKHSLVLIFLTDANIDVYQISLQVNHVRQHLKGLQKSDGLYPNFLNPNTGRWGTSKYLRYACMTLDLNHNGPFSDPVPMGYSQKMFVIQIVSELNMMGL